MVAKQGDQQYDMEYCKVSQSLSEFISEYESEVLDLAGEWRLSQGYTQRWIVELSAVWGNVQSVIEMEYAWGCGMERLRQESRCFGNQITPWLIAFWTCVKFNKRTSIC